MVVKEDLGKLNDEGKANLEALIAAISAEAKLPYQIAEDAKARDNGSIAKGREAFEIGFGAYTFVECH